MSELTVIEASELSKMLRREVGRICRSRQQQAAGPAALRALSKSRQI